MDNRLEFKSNVDGKDVDLVVVGVTAQIRSDSNSVYSKALFEAVDNGAPFIIEVEDKLRQRKLLDDEADNKLREELIKEIRSLEVQLRSAKIGSRKLTKDEGRILALNIKDKRAKLSNLSQNRSSLFNHTAENIAENTRLNYCVYRCTLRKDNLENYWKSYDDFKNDTTSTVYADAVKHFIALMMGVDADSEKKLYENQWLIRMGFMNDKLQLVDSKSRIVDEKGRLIDSEGRFINESGEFVDAFGNLLDKNGDLLVPDGWQEQAVESLESKELV